MSTVFLLINVYDDGYHNFVYAFNNYDDANYHREMLENADEYAAYSDACYVEPMREIRAVSQQWWQMYCDASITRAQLRYKRFEEETAQAVADGIIPF